MNKKKPSSKRNSIVKPATGKHVTPLALEILSKNAKKNTGKPASTKKPRKRLSEIKSPPSEYISECNSSIDSVHFANQTKLVTDQVLQSLSAFKAATANFLTQNQTFEDEVNTFELEFKHVQKEVEEIYWETSKSTLDMMKIKKKLLETPDKLDFISTKQSPGLNFSEEKAEGNSFSSPKEEFYRLKKEVEELKRVLHQNEGESRIADQENQELKSIAYRLQDSLSGQSLEIGHGNVPICKSCEIY